MGAAISRQVFSLTGALLLGLGLGLVYDLLRLLRRSHRHWMEIVLDLLFWLLCTLTLFLWSVWTGKGVVRVYIALALLGGGWLWFQTFSEQFLALGRRLMDICAQIAHILGYPVRRAAALRKKILIFFKKNFHYWLNWYRIEAMFSAAREKRPRGKVVHQEGSARENHKSKPDHEDRHFHFNRLFVHLSPESAQQNSDRVGRVQRHSKSGGGPKRQKRRR